MSWKARSVTLQKLLYPELAAADAYKGILLCNASIDNGPHCENILLHFGVATWQKKISKKGAMSVPVLENVLQSTEYKTWLGGEKSKEGHLERTLNSLRGHRKDLWVASMKFPFDRSPSWLTRIDTTH
jgi:hypothetical protein